MVAEQLRRRPPGGIGTYLRGLVQGLRALGPAAPELSLWASRPPSGGDDPAAALGPVKTSPLPGRALVAAWDRGLLAYKGPADVVHAPSLAVPPRGGAPLTVMVHDVSWRRVPEAFPRRGRRWHEAALGRARARASLLLAPSRSTADDLVAAGVPAARVEVVEEGSDHLPAPDPSAAADVLAHLQVGGPYLLSVSTLEPRKNLERLVAAYVRARPRLPEPCPLVVVGPRGWGDRRLPEAEGVAWAGWLDDATLSGLYARSLAVAYVPLLEGFGLPALEAMAAGTAVVASPMPSTGGAALEVDPLDVRAIAEALVRVACDDDTRQDLVEAGLARARSLTWAAAAAHHVELWRALV